MKRKDYARRAAGLLTVLIWSSCFVAIKGTEGDAPPLIYATLRATIGGVFLLVIAAAKGRLRPPPGTWPWLLLLGLTNTTLGLAGMFLSVGLAGATIPSILANSQALLVAPLAAWFFGERLTGRRIVGLIMGVAGIGLTTLMGSSAASDTWAFGVLLGLVAAVGVGAGNLIIKHVAGRIDPLTAVSWQYVFGAIGLFLWSTLAEPTTKVQWTPKFLIGLVYLGVIASAGTSWLWYRLLKSEALIPLNSLTLLTPVLAVFLAWVLFRESVAPVGWAGIVLTLIGVALVSLPVPASRRHECNSI